MLSGAIPHESRNGPFNGKSQWLKGAKSLRQHFIRVSIEVYNQLWRAKISDTF